MQWLRKELIGWDVNLLFDYTYLTLNCHPVSWVLACTIVKALWVQQTFEQFYGLRERLFYMFSFTYNKGNPNQNNYVTAVFTSQISQIVLFFKNVLVQAKLWWNSWTEICNTYWELYICFMTVVVKSAWSGVTGSKWQLLSLSSSLK